MSEPRTVAFDGLDVLWLQIAGTTCNLACRHCFVSAGPGAPRIASLSLGRVREVLEDALPRGLREVWFTGGEPLGHPDVLPMLDHALPHVAVGVLTNGTVIDHAMAEALASRARRSAYDVEIRVSLDGADEATNDAIRGRGAFSAACIGIAALAHAGLEPSIAVSGVVGAGTDLAAYQRLLAGLGVTRPRIRLIPAFALGREARRSTRPFAMIGGNTAALQCRTARAITADGVFPCPLLVDEPGERMSEVLADALAPNRIDHAACATCLATGFSCAR